MDWSKGYTSSYYLSVVDPDTWRDIDRVEIKGGTVNRDLEGLMQSASIDVVNYPNRTERWVRIYMDARQEGSNAHVPIFTGIATSPKQGWDGRIHDDNLECYSVLKPCSDIYLPLGWYASSGRIGSEVILELLGASAAPASSEGVSPALSSHIIAESGETYLTMIDKILNAINWRIRIDGYGNIHVSPKASDISASFDACDNDVIESQISIESDWYQCPNVYMAVTDSESAVARDESSDGILSISSRGREVWKHDASVELSEEETLIQYARRKLKEAQQFELTANYSRRFIPEVYPGDTVSLSYHDQGLVGDYTVTSQSIEIEFCARTTESIKNVE